MKNMTLAHIAEVCGGTYFGPEEKKTEEELEQIRKDMIDMKSPIL